MEALTRVVTLSDHQPRIVDIRADLSVGDATLRVHGLSPSVSRETRDRVRAAIRNSGLSWPDGVVHLTASTAHPRADVDLAAAAAALLVTGAVPVRRLTATALIGELGLDGTVRPVPDILGRAVAAADAGFTHLVVPAANAADARAVPGLTVIPVAGLGDLISWLRSSPAPDLLHESGVPGQPGTSWAPRAWAQLSPTAVRAAVVAAAGGHHTLHVAGPGDPVLLVPRLIRTLMADLSDTGTVEVNRLHSLAGEPLPDNGGFTRPPAVSLHPTDTIAAIVGSFTRPGLLTLAHRGVLTVEDLPAFSAATLEVLRPAMDNGSLAIADADGTGSHPAGARIVFTTRDCLCGSARAEECRCTPLSVPATSRGSRCGYSTASTCLSARSPLPSPIRRCRRWSRSATASPGPGNAHATGGVPYRNPAPSSTTPKPSPAFLPRRWKSSTMRSGTAGLRPAPQRGVCGWPGHVPTWTAGRTRTSPISG